MFRTPISCVRLQSSAGDDGVNTASASPETMQNDVNCRTSQVVGFSMTGSYQQYEMRGSKVTGLKRTFIGILRTHTIFRRVRYICLYTCVLNKKLMKIKIKSLTIV